MLARIFISRVLTDRVEKRARELFDVTSNAADVRLDKHEFIAAAKGFENVLVASGERIDREVVAALRPELKILATQSVGHDHIDLDACREAGVAVLNTPDVLTESTAEMGLFLLLAAARRGHEGDQLVRQGKWVGFSPTDMLSPGLAGRRLGIFGMGRIGRAVALRAKACGMSISYHNRSRVAPDLEDGALYFDTLDDLMRNCDALIICAPGSAALDGAINAERLALLPDGAILVNIARGVIVDDDALIAALKSGKIFAAGLDVFRNEPDLDPRYRELDNVFLMPHLGSATLATRDAMGMLAVEGIAAILRGQEPHNRIA